MKRLLVVLLLLAVAFAQISETAGYAEVRISIEGYTPKPQTVYLPQNDARQNVDYGKLPVQYDAYGNALLVLEGNYSLLFDVEVDASKPDIVADRKFPTTVNGPQQYLEETAYCLSEDAETKQRALDVTRNSRTILQAIRDLGLWTNSYLEYDISYWGDILTSKEALTLRKGVCDEFTNVYTAMARSLGIPTRIATGMVYTGSQWQRHAWAESLVGDVWVPVDPTFSEVGMVNALHIKLYSAPTYLFYQFPQSLEDIRIVEYTIDDYTVPLAVEAELSHGRVPPKGTFFLTANVTNYGNNVIIPTYAAQKTVGVELLSDFRQSAIISSGESKIIHWKFAAPFGERETYYVFIVGPRADEKFPIIVDPLLSAEGYTDFELKNVYASVIDEGIRIEAEVKNIGSSDYAGVVATVTTDLGTQQQTFSLVSGDSKVIEFIFPAEVGTHSYEIKIDAGNSSTNVFGTVSVSPQQGKTRSISEVVSEFVAESAGWIYLGLAVIVLVAILLVLMVPLQEDRKIPFEEKEEWGRLMKLRKGE